MNDWRELRAEELGAGLAPLAAVGEADGDAAERTGADDVRRGAVEQDGDEDAADAGTGRRTRDSQERRLVGAWSGQREVVGEGVEVQLSGGREGEDRVHGPIVRSTRDHVQR